MHPLTATFELVQKAQTGDDAALNQLFERYYPRVRKVVRARIGAKLRSRIETSDLLQHTFMTAVRKFGEFDMRDEASLIHWLSTLAHNQIRDLAKFHNADRRDPNREIPVDRPLEGDDCAGGLSLPDKGSSPLDSIAQQEAELRLEQALDGLAENHREAILLRDYEGFSWGEVAERIGSPSPDAARMLHGVAKAKLAAALRKLGDPPPD